MIYHFQTESGYVLSDVYVTNNIQTWASGSVTASWGADGSSWTLLEYSGPVGYSEFDIPINVSGFTGTDLYLKYDLWGAPSAQHLFSYNGSTATGFKVQYNLIPPVPEPSTWAMLAVGGLALLGYWGMRRFGRTKAA